MVRSFDATASMLGDGLLILWWIYAYVVCNVSTEMEEVEFIVKWHI